jgi:hypothetical protein
MIFEVDAEQISQLDSVALAQLMMRLLLAECQLVDIPLRAAVVPLQITVPDGGEDGRVEWSGGIETTNYLPSRFSIFQSKAQNLTEGTIKTEILTKAKNKRSKSKPKLNDAVSEALSQHGSYVVFCSKPFTGQKIGKLRRTIEGVVQQTGADPLHFAKIDIYDANKIADWVNTHPAVALWLTNHARRRSVSGFQSLAGWKRSAYITGVLWVANESPRFVPADGVIPDGRGGDRQRNGWTFAQAAEAALRHLSNDQRIVRIVGPSGFGKSRFT